MGILFTITMGFLFTITIGILFTIVLGIQFTISIREISLRVYLSKEGYLFERKEQIGFSRLKVKIIFSFGWDKIDSLYYKKTGFQSLSF